MSEPPLFTTPQQNQGSLLGPKIGFAIAFVLVAVTIAYLVWDSQFSERRVAPRPAVQDAASITDPNAALLKVSDVHMLAANNMIGGKMYYVEGKVTNTGKAIATGASVEVTFHDFSNAVVQREQRPLMVILRREPAVDIGALGIAPLKPGESKEFQIIFDHLEPSWNTQPPDVRVVTAVMQ